MTSKKIIYKIIRFQSHIFFFNTTKKYLIDEVTITKTLHFYVKIKPFFFNNKWCYFQDLIVDIYRITVVMNVETEINSSITASLIGQAVILVIMYVKSFKTAVIVLICIVIMCLISPWPIVVIIAILFTFPLMFKTDMFHIT